MPAPQFLRLRHADLMRLVPPSLYPRGWQVGPPDYVGIGAQRSGTTWWHALIGVHPDVFVLPGAPKERHFFRRFEQREFDEREARRYARLFPRPRGRATGEWTPRYMFDPGTPAHLRRAAPDARLLVMLRDPVERFRSARQSSAAETAEARERGFYFRQLERVLEHFRREQLLVLQYERCLAEPAMELRRTYEFLGLDPDFVPAGLTERVNAARRPRPPLARDELRELAELYRPDAEALAAAFPEIDLALWTSLAG